MLQERRGGVVGLMVARRVNAGDFVVGRQMDGKNGWMYIQAIVETLYAKPGPNLRYGIH